tara:strand:- start:202 stop:630 length:429 start_codon:yes stop_codon:yes gene_type:complete
MAIYYSWYCHSCNYQLVDDTTLHSIGVTHIICPNCGKGNRQKKGVSPLSYKNTFGKLFAYIDVIVNLKFFVFWFMPIIAVPEIILRFIIKTEFIYENYFGGYVLTMMLVSIIIRIASLQTLINQVEIKQKEIEKKLGIEPVN